MWFKKKKCSVENVKTIKPNLQGVKNEIYKWNSLYPLDKWWRDKYKISFNSDAHRESCLLDILQEYTEERIYNKIINDLEKEEYKKGDWINEGKIEMSNEEMIESFEKFLNI